MVKIVLQTVDDNSSFVRYFKSSITSDELMILTILFNNQEFLAGGYRIMENVGHYNEMPTLYYPNYEPAVEVFNESAYSSILASGKPFFRKARAGNSDKLLDMIDAYRAN